MRLKIQIIGVECQSVITEKVICSVVGFPVMASVDLESYAFDDGCFKSILYEEDT